MSWLKWIKPRKKIKVIEECKQLHSFWHEWTQEPSPSNLIKIIEALLSEENHLMLPTLKQTFHVDQINNKVDLPILLSSVKYHHDKKTLYAFTDEDLLKKWMTREVHYNVLSAPSVMDICNQQEIQQIILNPGTEKDCIISIESKSISNQVTILPPHDSLPFSITQAMTYQLNQVEEVKAVYQYTQENNHQKILCIGVVLFHEKPDSETHIHQVIGEVISHTTFPLQFEVHIIRRQDWIDTLTTVPGACLLDKAS